MEAQRCLAEPGPALVCTYRGTNTREDAGGCREGEKRKEVEMAEMMKAKRDGEGVGERRRGTSKTRLTRSPNYLAAYRRDIYGIEERGAKRSRF